jgi:pyrroloquinoline quinone biosynthesis protein E
VGLNEKRIASLKNAGLDHIQLSFQDSTQEMNDFLSSTKTFELKKKVASLIKQYDYPMVMNVVLHRHNIPHVDKIIDMALDLGAEYLELANTQYYGWAMKNRQQLLPTREQLIDAEATVNAYREKIGKRCKLLFVVPDYFEERPKACMNGWGSIFLDIAPDGAALPCHNARELPGLDIPNVKDHSIREIWVESQAFNFFRGDNWMQEPCRSCSEKEKDFGGCRCQAFLLTGDAAATDPVCAKSPKHHIVKQAINEAALIHKPGQPSQTEHPLVFRTDKNSRLLSDAKH